MSKLKSERISTRSPFSIRGAIERCRAMYGWPRRAALWLRVLAGIGITVLMLAWVAVTVAGWGCLGLFMIPVLLIGRGRRKRRLAEARHREMLSATGQAGGR